MVYVSGFAEKKCIPSMVLTFSSYNHQGPQGKFSRIMLEYIDNSFARLFNDLMSRTDRDCNMKSPKTDKIIQ